MKYAVFTVMTPDWDLTETVQHLAALGYDGVEWRVTEPANPAIRKRMPERMRRQARYWLDNRATVDPARLAELAPELKRLTEGAGLAFCSLATYLPVHQVDEIERVKNTEWARERIFQIIDRRYSAAEVRRSVTLMASNSSPDDLDGYLASRACDGRFKVRYEDALDVVYLHGDSAVSHSGDYVVTGLDIDEFHTYRFESLDGVYYEFSVDGLVFMVGYGDSGNGYHYLQFGGFGGCSVEELPTTHEWDYIRYGTIDTSPSSMNIETTDPPEGYLDPGLYPELDRFTVTFGAPNFVFTDEISIQVTGGVAPEVSRVWRRDDHGPETVEIILDRPIPMDEATTFTFNDGRSGDTVYYTYLPQAGIPAVSTWGMVVMTLLLLSAGTLLFRPVKRIS